MANDASTKAELEALRREMAKLTARVDAMTPPESARIRERPAPEPERAVRNPRSWRMYTSFAERKRQLESLPEKEVVDRILDPVANQYRMQILKLLLAQSRTFSEISGITGMKGGNLLFHLQKLVESGMVSQRYERGDYLLTDKGLNVLEALSDLYEEEK
jgi:DNA-binding HxlR family transcriptional regulator